MEGRALARRTCGRGVAIHVLAVLAYREGDRVTSALLAASDDRPHPLQQLRRAGLMLAQAGL